MCNLDIYPIVLKLYNVIIETYTGMQCVSDLISQLAGFRNCLLFHKLLTRHVARDYQNDGALFVTCIYINSIIVYVCIWFLCNIY